MDDDIILAGLRSFAPVALLNEHPSPVFLRAET